MKILFLGQHGIPVYGRVEATPAERRVEALALSLAAMGHQVSVTCARPYIPRTVRALGGVALLHLASLDPRQPGGWLYTLLEVVVAGRLAPDAVHLSGWRQALLSPVLGRLVPSATIILTLDAAPSGGWSASWRRRALSAALRAVDTITVPTRKLQSQLLQDFGVVAEYVPDGYSAPKLPLLPLSYFGVRKRQAYFVAAVSSPATLRWLVAAWKQSRLTQKVLVLAPLRHDSTGQAEMSPRERRVAKKYPFLRFMGDLQGRKLASLLAGSSGVLLLDPLPDRRLLLAAMQAGLPVIAVNDPLLQETAGVTARFVAPGKTQDLAEELRGVFGRPTRRVYYGSRGRKRARAHFTWERIAEEYLGLYVAPFARPVYLDSVQRSAHQHQGLVTSNS